MFPFRPVQELEIQLQRVIHNDFIIRYILDGINPYRNCSLGRLILLRHVLEQDTTNMHRMYDAATTLMAFGFYRHVSITILNELLRNLALISFEPGFNKGALTILLNNILPEHIKIAGPYFVFNNCGGGFCGFRTIAQLTQLSQLTPGVGAAPLEALGLEIDANYSNSPAETLIPLIEVVNTLRSSHAPTASPRRGESRALPIPYHSGISAEISAEYQVTDDEIISLMKALLNAAENFSVAGAFLGLQISSLQREIIREQPGTHFEAGFVVVPLRPDSILAVAYDGGHWEAALKL